MEEYGSEDVDAVCGEASVLVLSVLCLPEIVSAFNRRLREKKLTRRDYELLKKRLAEEIKDAWIVNLTPGVIEVSVSLLEKKQPPGVRCDPYRLRFGMQSGPVRFRGQKSTGCGAKIRIEDSVCRLIPGFAISVKSIGQGKIKHDFYNNPMNKKSGLSGRR